MGSWLTFDDDTIFLNRRSAEIIPIDLGFNAEYFLSKIEKSGQVFAKTGVVRIDTDDNIASFDMVNVTPVGMQLDHLKDLLEGEASKVSQKFFFDGDDGKINHIKYNGGFSFSVWNPGEQCFYGADTDITPEIILEGKNTKFHSARDIENQLGYVRFGPEFIYLCFYSSDFDVSDFYKEGKARFLAWCSRLSKEMKPGRL